MAQSEERANRLLPPKMGVSGCRPFNASTTSCCATSVTRGNHRRSGEGCLRWADGETPAMVRSRRFPQIWTHSVSLLVFVSDLLQSRKWNYGGI